MSGVTEDGAILWQECDVKVIGMFDEYGDAVGVDSSPAVTESPGLDRDMFITFVLL